MGILSVVVPSSTAGRLVNLPAARLHGRISLEEVLARRRSIRSFAPVPLSPDELSQLLWAAQGITSSWDGRTAPSAGALYPLDVYVVTGAGLGHYVPDGHRLLAVAETDLRQALCAAAHGQAAVAQAAAVFVITAVQDRSAEEYGPRAERFVTLEAGHAAQNVLLEAVALGLGAVSIGAFADDGVKASLDLPADHDPLYLIAVGRPEAEAA